MAGTGCNSVRVLQRLLSFPTMLASLLVLLVVLTVRGRFDDSDLWWHLKMGQVIWTTHSIPAKRPRNARWFYGLPVVFVIWINCHASFILGIVVAGVYLFSSFFNFEIGSLVARRWDPHCRRTLVGALIVSVVGLFLNPGGIKQILYPFDTLMNMHILMANVQEWAPLQMTEARGIGLMAVVVCCLLLAVTRPCELFLEDLLLLAMGTWLAVGHLRMLIGFGMVAAPILSRQLANSWENYEVEEDRIWPNAVMIAVSLLG